MAPSPSLASASFAGVWAALGLVPFDMWMDRHGPMNVFGEGLLWGLAVLIFFLIPGKYFVLGQDHQPFDRTWFADPDERLRYGVLVKRMLAWFFAAAVFGVFWVAGVELHRGDAMNLKSFAKKLVNRCSVGPNPALVRTGRLRRPSAQRVRGNAPC